MRSIILFIFFSIGIQAFGQHLPVPVFTHVSVQDFPQQKVRLEWGCSKLQDIDGFIIYRTSYDLPAIADSAFTPLVEISDNQAKEYFDLSFENQNPDIGKHHYAYKIASYKKNGSDYEYSELSKAIAPLYLKNISLQKCNSEILLQWQSAYGMDLTNLQIKAITAENEFSINAAASNSAIIALDELNLYTAQNADSIKACFTISGANNGKMSYSNTLCMAESTNQNLQITVDSLIINEPDLTLYFNTIQNTGIYYFTVATYLNNQLSKTDTLTAEKREFSMERSNFENLQFTITAYNQCHISIGNSYKISPVLISSYQNEPTTSAFAIQSEQQFNETESVIKSSLLASTQNGSFTIIEETSYLPPFWTDENLEESVAKAYKLRIITQNSILPNFETIYQSNTLKLYKESQMLIPNAIHLLAPNEKDRFFSVKASFVSSFSLEIFDNKGIKLFSTDDIFFRWQPSNSEQTTAYSVYFYVVNYKNSKGINYVLKDKFIVFR